MKTILFSLIFTLSTFLSFSQIQFEAGYFINNSNERIEGFIKNLDWRNNPTKIEFKSQENSNSEIIAMDAMNEFGLLIANQKYIKVSIDIDRSPSIGDLSKDKNPFFKEETLLLKVLLEGKVSIYEYNDGSLQRFFYQDEQLNLKQLVYKKYNSIENAIGENNYFKQQLFNSLKCKEISKNQIEAISYSSKSLLNLFKAYNNCSNITYTEYQKKKNGKSFHLTLRPGVTSSSYEVFYQASQYYRLNPRNAEFDTKIGSRLGVELEYVFPFNKSKWALIFEPTYQKYTADTNLELVGEVNVEYKFIEFPLGVRHYLYLKNQSKLFANASIVYTTDLNSLVEYEGGQKDLEMKSNPNLGFGIGYKHLEKLSLELRYYTVRDALGNLASIKGNYNNLSLIFGYTLF